MENLSNSSPPTPAGSPAQPPPLPLRALATVQYQTGPASEINYFRFQPAGSGWMSIASFGTAHVWHDAQSLLSRHHITCKMVDEQSPGGAVERRMGLAVLATEAEWARDLLNNGIPALAGSVESVRGFPVLPSKTAPGADLSTSFPPPLAMSSPPLARTPLHATPVNSLQVLPKTGATVGYTLFLIFLWIALGVVVIVTVLACFA